jgi:hypothetical protein
MPAAVRNFAENSFFPDIQRIQNNILTSIQYDFAKYGTGKQHGVPCKQYYGIVAVFPGRKNQIQ